MNSLHLPVCRWFVPPPLLPLSEGCPLPPPPPSVVVRLRPLPSVVVCPHFPWRRFTLHSLRLGVRPFLRLGMGFATSSLPGWELTPFPFIGGSSSPLPSGGRMGAWGGCFGVGLRGSVVRCCVVGC